MTTTQPRARAARRLVRACGALSASLACSWPMAAEAPPLQALPELAVSSYLGTWFQVAYFPNRFQSHCVSDTTATYRLKARGTLEVINRCRQANGSVDEAVGVARPVHPIEDDRLRPAQLSVSFLPVWLQWLPIGRGDYWVIQRAADGRYAVVSEPTRRYLWVLARAPVLSAQDESEIRSRLLSQGFDLARWAAHPQSATPSAPARP